MMTWKFYDHLYIIIQLYIKPFIEEMQFKVIYIKKKEQLQTDRRFHIYVKRGENNEKF